MKIKETKVAGSGCRTSELYNSSLTLYCYVIVTHCRAIWRLGCGNVLREKINVEMR